MNLSSFCIIATALNVKEKYTVLKFIFKNFLVDQMCFGIQNCLDFGIVMCAYTIYFTPAEASLNENISISVVKHMKMHTM